MITAASTASLSSGGCACGAARFVAEGEHYRGGLCHCFDCRKQYSAPSGAFANFPRTGLHPPPSPACSCPRPPFMN